MQIRLAYPEKSSNLKKKLATSKLFEHVFPRFPPSVVHSIFSPTDVLPIFVPCQHPSEISAYWGVLEFTPTEVLPKTSCQPLSNLFFPTNALSKFIPTDVLRRFSPNGVLSKTFRRLFKISAKKYIS